MVTIWLAHPLMAVNRTLRPVRGASTSQTTPAAPGDQRRSLAHGDPWIVSQSIHYPRWAGAQLVGYAGQTRPASACRPRR